jgi:Outer membrane protein beta-barrel domain
MARWASIGIVIALCGVQSTWAERKPVAFGMLGGITGTTLWGDDIHAPDARIWLTTGLSLAFHLPAFLGVEADLLYVGKDAAYKEKTASNEDQVNKITSHALAIPVLLKITAPTESEVQPVFYLGWSFDRWLTKDFTSEIIATGPGGIIAPEALPPEIAKSDLPGWEQALIVGGGVEWGLGTFQLRFSLGQNTIDGTERLDIKTLVTTVMAGFLF